MVSSSSVLNHYLDGGEDGGHFGKEESFPRPTTFYSATKQAVESLGLNYAKWCGIEFAGLRYGAAFGPWSGAGGGGPSNVMRDAIRNALAGSEALVPPGAMEWVYSKDAARAHRDGARRQGFGQPHLQRDHGTAHHAGRDGGGDPTRCRARRSSSRRRTGTAISLANRSEHADLSRAKKHLGYEPQFPLQEAVHDLAEWTRRFANS